MTKKGGINIYSEGIITKGIGGFYYVDTADGYFECRARGGFRKDGITPLVGDRVCISIDEMTGSGAVEEILPRKNVLLRPPVANVTQIAVVIATANPKPNLYLIDKLLASAELLKIGILICLNKIDIESGDELCDIYKKAGFCVLPMCAKERANIDKLGEKLRDNTTVFAGNSGVGKSSILNCVTNSDAFATGEISERVERGRHTTRHSELVSLKCGGYIIDTPGFGSFDFSLLNPKNCAELFREFEPYTNACKFSDCSHTVEKGCGVLTALEKGEISASRHKNYVRLFEEVRSAQNSNQKPRR